MRNISAPHGLAPESCVGYAYLVTSPVPRSLGNNIPLQRWKWKITTEPWGESHLLEANPKCTSSFVATQILQSGGLLGFWKAYCSTTMELQAFSSKVEHLVGGRRVDNAPAEGMGVGEFFRCVCIQVLAACSKVACPCPTSRNSI